MKKLLGSGVTGVDEMLKALDVVGAGQLRQPINVAWRSWTVPLEWKTRMLERRL